MVGIGTLDLRSAAATPLIEDLYRLNNWLRGGLVLLSSRPTQDQPVEQLPRIFTELVDLGVEFRSGEISKLGKRWIANLPKVPVTREETRTVTRDRMGWGGLIVCQRLSALGSVSATQSIILGLTPRIIKDIFIKLAFDQFHSNSIGRTFLMYFQGWSVVGTAPAL